MNQPSSSVEPVLSPAQGDRLIRLFQDSFDNRPAQTVAPSATSPARYWQPTLTDLTGRVVHALDPLLVEQQSPDLPPALRWVQPDATDPVSAGFPLVPPHQPFTPVLDAPAVARPAAKPTL